MQQLQQNTGRTYDAIYVIGGGSNAGYLNQLTADATGKTVYAGPAEATAAGNMMAQMIKGKEFWSLNEARKCIFQSFAVISYEPQS